MNGITLNLSGLRRLPLFRCNNPAETGLACLAMISAWHGHDIDMAAMRRRFPTYLKGTTSSDLAQIASSLGFSARLFQCDADSLHSVQKPCIVFWDSKRHVVLEKASGSYCFINDPVFGRRQALQSEVATHLNSPVVELQQAEGFKRGKYKDRIGLFQLITFSNSVVISLVQIAALSLFLQLTSLLSPFYMQLIIDSVIAAGDLDLLAVLAIAFGCLAIFAAMANTLRALTFQFLSNTVASDLSVRLYHHLFRLPTSFFRDRALGDLFQKFRGVESLRQFVGGGAIGVLTDGLLAIVTCILMFAYNVYLGSIVIFVAGIYVAGRLFVTPINTHFFASMYEADGRECSHFFETVRGVPTLKLAMGMQLREAKWRNLFAARVNNSIKSGNITAVFQAFVTLLTTLSDVVVVYVGAHAVIDNKMTLGAIVAFMAYKSQFMARIFSVADQYSLFRTLDAQIDRISDIALAEPEIARDVAHPSLESFKGDVLFKNVSFRYTEKGRLIMKDLNLSVSPGDFIAIVGPSGAGKSTILGLLLGLLNPTEGEIYIDGHPMSLTGPDLLRRHCGAVIQEAIIFTGTVAENISLFDEDIDMALVQESAKNALIDSDIMALANQYNTVLGEHGATLSSGQRQRILLARTLYRRPSILVMDEGTANLDPDSEEKIIRTLRSLKITCILATHSMAVAGAADKIYEMSEGTLRPLDKGSLVRG